MKAFLQRQTADRTGVGATGTDVGDGGKVRGNMIEIHGRRKGMEAIAIEEDGGLQKATRSAKDDNTGINEFGAFDAGDNADNRVIAGVRSGH
ncbi:MAG: hypothetical protein NVS2B7_18110 [Herpetosiphon sp.]